MAEGIARPFLALATLAWVPAQTPRLWQDRRFTHRDCAASYQNACRVRFTAYPLGYGDGDRLQAKIGRDKQGATQPQYT